MHILGHNPAVSAILCIGLQGEFFDGREPNREATAEESPPRERMSRDGRYE